MRVEWPTVALILLCYVTWMGAVFWLAVLSMPLAIAVAALAITLQSSLQHEVLHGHPFRQRMIGVALVFPSLNLCIPYIRFRDQHLAHHMDAKLTDPYDDPESNYLDPAVWSRLARPVRVILNLNNTLLGRIFLGPLISQVAFMADDWRLIQADDKGVLRAWALHLVTVTPIIALVIAAPMPVWAYLLAAYFGLGILKIRTFLEHQAHDRARGRTVIVEDRGILAFLFLNNNLHVVHHKHPKLPWYRLPEAYFPNREKYLSRNEGYRYRSYAQIVSRHLFRAKDPVPHPLWPQN